MEKIIVKVQVSLFTSEDEPQVLVYSENHKHQYEGPVTEEVIYAMDGEPKKFFYARIPKKPGMIELLEEAPWQSW